MSDLLQIGASGVRAANAALATIGENVSNASTEGYTRRTISMSEAPASRDASTGNLNGVVVSSVGRASDDYKATANRTATSGAASASAYSDWMSKVEAAMSDDSAGIGQSATTIFAAGDTLAANPGDTSNRKAFLDAIGTTTAAFNDTATSLATAASDVVSAATTSVQAINTTLDSLDNVNASLHAVRAGTAAQANLLDQRDKLLSSLSSQIGVDVTLATDGSATVRIAGGGTTLANSGGSAARLTLSTGTGSNLGRITVNAIGTTNDTPIAQISGTLGGLVQAADTIAQRRVGLDTLAQSFATQINAWSAQGTDANGAAGANLVSGTTAATLALATSDTSKVPAANSSTANGNLLTLSSLRGDSGIEKQWAATVTDVGRAVDAAKTASTAATSRSEATAAALNEVTSVDLDTEASDLIRFQQAYAGAAKVIQAARDTMQALLNVI